MGTGPARKDIINMREVANVPGPGAETNDIMNSNDNGFVFGK